MRVLLVAAVATLTVLAGRARAGTPVRCDDLSSADLTVDGLLDDWPNRVMMRTGAPPDGQVALRCAWDGAAFAFALDVVDDRLVRVRSGKAHEDHVTVTIAAGGKPIAIDVYPGNATAKARIVKPARVAVADSLQPKGFSVEGKVPAAAVPGFSGSTPKLDVVVEYHDSDQATGGADASYTLDLQVELGDRKDLLEDFLRTVRLEKKAIVLDAMANLDPERPGKERIVAGGTVIGILTDQYAFVQVPGPIQKIELLPLGAGFDVVAAVVGERLMLWTVWSGQLDPLGDFDGSTYRVDKRTRTLFVEGAAYVLKGKELVKK